MDVRRDDERKRENEQPLQEEAKIPQTASSEEQEPEQPIKKPELIMKQDTDEQSDNMYKETAAALENAKETRTAKEKRRKASWLSPILGGIIGGGLVLGISPYLPVDKHNDAVKESQTEPKQSQNFSTKPVTDADNVPDMVEDLESTIVGVSNIQTSFGFSEDDVEESGTGSGVIFKKDGKKAYIITNNHVVEGATKVTISLYNGKTTDAKIIGSDALTDLAVLEISSKGIDKVASFGDSSKLRAGEKVIAIGNPLGLQFSRTVTEGIISGVNRTIEVSTSEGKWDMNVLQTDAAINPGNSGGPLINSGGQVIGINSLKISQTGVESLGFAIPSNDVEPIVDQLLDKGKVVRPFLGVQMIDMQQVPEQYQQNTLGLFGDQLNKGVYVDKVSPGSPAADAGMKAGDVIVKMNGKSIETTSDLRKILYTEAKAGDTVSFEVLRKGKEKTLKAKLTESKS
ncbi:S1C family serine protease [Bacillus glycinifermentans]|uniref:Serine protease n=1 Tax=Bacillus glycinifermentans TaxID=1664069 RepID=A0A0T6BRW5_9BACI|nr:trypsin-like peptidase domain-containing protein [Bacillus glycinifermentans]ATH93080.1 serine protease [Bacillus glycinifermentans]KRT94323.1 serine protease [Bacillus glycinifermentans]MEC0485852.1 trypsin-like peptidase domain-containing protein [Bacillus glycinifermentans]MEC0495678.1 trypsin-like peptidase domain-containing protein [Bacillus glycinifermentans]MEC0542097.1 trypsin-like peptidase domain-containing protein [Bacillus glycinifermentans]